MTIITLLTDYGIRDSYVAEVKGAILKINPEVTLVDISHDIGNYEIEEGAFNLARSVPYFPDGTIHVGVVDPGVGGDRKSIIIKSRGAYLVGPDNGLLAPAAERLGVEEVFEIANSSLLPERVSLVFDGRDVFGPVAALLAKGTRPDKIVNRIQGYIRLPNYEPKLVGNRVEARIIHVDGFGNLVTNVTQGFLRDLGLREGSKVITVIHGREFIIPYVGIFSAVPKGELLMLVAGGDYLELSINQGSARSVLSVERGEKINLVL